MGSELEESCDSRSAIWELSDAGTFGDVTLGGLPCSFVLKNARLDLQGGTTGVVEKLFLF